MHLEHFPAFVVDHESAALVPWWTCQYDCLAKNILLQAYLWRNQPAQVSCDWRVEMHDEIGRLMHPIYISPEFFRMGNDSTYRCPSTHIEEQHCVVFLSRCQHEDGRFYEVVAANHGNDSSRK